jgi:D-3-phosphoglycerate dehydrogenase
VALLLAVWRRLPAYTAHVAGGGFDWKATGRIDSLAAQTVGVLGFGRIGQSVARRLSAFGCSVAGSSRRDSPAYASLGVERLPVDELLRHSSALVVTAPLNDDTRDLLDERHLRLLPQGAVVVNVGRGNVLDTPALARLLAEGHLSGAGLDVFRSEPPGPDELAVLDASPNVVLTPHAGWYAADTETEIRRTACAHLLEELARPPGGTVQAARPLS